MEGESTEVKKPEDNPAAYLSVIPEIRNLLVKMNEKLDALSSFKANDDEDEEDEEMPEEEEKATQAKIPDSTEDTAETPVAPDEKPFHSKMEKLEKELADVKKELDKYKNIKKTSRTSRPVAKDVHKSVNEAANAGSYALEVTKENKTWDEIHRKMKEIRENKLVEMFGEVS